MKIDRHIRFHFARKCNLGAALVLVLLVATVAHAQLTPSDDAYVNSAAPTTNYGAATTLDLSSAADTTFIRFDLTAVPAGTPGSSIAKATLKLYVNSVTTAGSFNVDYVTGTWVEKTITNNLQPAIGTTIASSVPLTTASKGKYVEIDVTAAMVEWLNGTQANDGIALVANSPLVATFDSKENTGTSHPAELDVVFASGNGTITGINTASGSGLMGGGNSGTLNLSLINTCSSGQVLSWNGTAWTCANLSGGGTITGVTAGTDLTGGGTSGKVTLNLDTTKVPQLNTPNNFTQAIGVNTNNPFGSIQATGTGEAIVGIMTTNNFLTAAIAGAATASGTGTTIGVEGSSSTNSGYGVYGTGGPSGAGVYGNGNSSGVGVSGNSSSGVGVSGTSSSGSGVYGQTTGASGAGVFGTNSVSGFGVLGQATGSSGQGVWGETFGNGFSNGAGADGVHGVAHTTGGSGVAGINTAQDGVAVYGSDPSGYGFYTDSHAHQDRSAGGWVKAMAYVDPFKGGIQRCFNSQLSGSQATTVPCGMSYTYKGAGYYIIDFGFQVDDRFLQATGYGGSVNACLDDYCHNGAGIGPNQVVIDTNDGSDQAFHLTVF